MGQLAQAIAATATSGIVRPVGVGALRQMARALRRFGKTPAALFAVTAARIPHQTAISDELGEITYRELQHRSERIAAAIYADSGQPPESVAVLCRNHRGFVEAVLAGAQLGAELVLINTELPRAQLHKILERHDPSVLVHDEEYTDALAGFTNHKIVAWQEVPTASEAEATLDALAARTEPAPPRVTRPVKLTLLTSGTTGLAKGVPRAPKPSGLLGVAISGMAATKLRSGERMAIAPPLFHGFGFLMLMGGIGSGATIHCWRRFDVHAIAEAIERRHITVFAGVPVMFQRLLELPAPASSALRCAITGAAPISTHTVRRFTDAYGQILINGYGSTEVGIVSIATPGDITAAVATVGRSAFGTTVKILRKDRTEAAAGETGVIFIRGGMTFTGYSADAAKPPQGKEIVRGLMNTGDMGHFDSAGRLFIDGRDDDMIVSGGENIFPGEVEEALAAHADVAEAVVIGVPSEEYGTVLRVFLVCKEKQPTVDELKTFVRGRLERYKVPKDFVYLDAIPRNPSGKVLRTQLDSTPLD